MKPVSSNCPNCGAPLPQSDSSKDIFCAYCGTNIQAVKEEKNANESIGKEKVFSLLFRIIGIGWLVVLLIFSRGEDIYLGINLIISLILPLFFNELKKQKKFVLKLLMWLGIVVAYFIISGLCWAVRA